MISKGPTAAGLGVAVSFITCCGLRVHHAQRLGVRHLCYLSVAHARLHASHWLLCRIEGHEYPTACHLPIAHLQHGGVRSECVCSSAMG